MLVSMTRIPSNTPPNAAPLLAVVATLCVAMINFSYAQPKYLKPGSRITPLFFLMDMRVASGRLAKISDALVLNPTNDPTIWGIIFQKSQWNSGQKLRVCFFRELRYEKIKQHYSRYISNFRLANENGKENQISPDRFVRLMTNIIIHYFGNATAQFEKNAKVWESYGDIRFSFRENGQFNVCNGNPYEIRVSFDQQRHWSLLGRASWPKVNPKTSFEHATLNIDLTNLSMQLGLLPWKSNRRKASTAATGIRAYFGAVVKHEIGHALGFFHEHQHPGSGCAKDLKWEVLYRRFPKALVDRNFAPVSEQLARYQQAKFLKFDPKSIMQYQIPASFLKRGKASPCFIAQQAVDISSGDKQMMRAAYPLRTSSRTTFSVLPAQTGPDAILEKYEWLIDQNRKMTHDQKRAAKTEFRKRYYK